MPKREDRLLIQDIIESIEVVFTYTQGMSFKEFISDRKTVDATVRNLEIIGEAASRTSETISGQNPLIDWNDMRRLRNRLIHDYFGIDLDIVWKVIKDELPHNYEMLKLIDTDNLPTGI